MIVVPIEARDVDDDTPQEWSLLELNGELLAPKTVRGDLSNGSTTSLNTVNPTVTLDNVESNTERNDDVRIDTIGNDTWSNSRVELGSVRFDPTGKPIFVIGSHELRGKIEELKQPFVVMRPQISSTQNKRQRLENGDAKRMNESNENSRTISDNQDANGNTKNDQSTRIYQMVGVVKKRFLFDRYPKSIVR